MTSTRWQRFVASDLPIWAWFIAGQLVGLAKLSDVIRPWPFLTFDLWIWSLVTICVILTAMVSLIASLIALAFVGPPLWYLQELANGGPFQIGDRVIVLAGPHAGRETWIYGVWQGNTLRVKLDPQDEIDFADIFPPYKLLRIPSDKFALKSAGDEKKCATY